MSFDYFSKNRVEYILSKLKTIIDTKQNTLTAQTAYTNKGSATKVPQITTNALGQVTGITEIEISQGGDISNKVDNTKAGANSLINKLEGGNSTPVDADYFISQYVGGGTTNTTYVRRPMSALWNYIKGKMNSDGYYKKPSSGIPKSDLASAVQTSLGKADTALQTHQDISGKVDNTRAGMNGLINNLDSGTSTPVDADYFIAQYSGGGTTNTTYLRKSMSSLWNYIKGKMNSDGYYKKPSSGIPKSDLASDIQTVINNAGNSAKNITLTNQNLDDVVEPGFYNASGNNSITNKPTGIDNFGMIVIHNSSGSYYTQILYNSRSSYIRNCYNGTWDTWKGTNDETNSRFKFYEDYGYIGGNLYKGGTSQYPCDFVASDIMIIKNATDNQITMNTYTNLGDSTRITYYNVAAKTEREVTITKKTSAFAFTTDATIDTFVYKKSPVSLPDGLITLPNNIELYNMIKNIQIVSIEEVDSNLRNIFEFDK